MKKAGKIIGRIILILLILFLIALIICFFYQKSAQKKDRELLEKDGFANLVSAGDFDMNVNILGDGKYTIIAMPGSGDSAFPVSMKQFYEHLSDDITLVTVLRPGYGISGGTKKDMTTEKIVESTRTALKNAGIEAPYILMPHSLSGIYGTYWESTYPDEISGVIFLDSNFEGDNEMPEKGVIKVMYNVMLNCRYFLDKSGLSRAIDAIKGEEEDDLYGEYAKDAAAFYGATDSSLTTQEMKNFVINNETAWSSIKSNDIPKIYITTDFKTIEDIKDYNDFYDFGLSEEDMQKRLEESTGEWKTELKEKRSRYIEKIGNCKEINIPGSHWIYEHKPDECAKVIEDFLKGLK